MICGRRLIYAHEYHLIRESVAIYSCDAHDKAQVRGVGFAVAYVEQERQRLVFDGENGGFVDCHGVIVRHTAPLGARGAMMGGCKEL